MASGSSGLAGVAAGAGGRSSNDKKLLVGAAVGAGAVVVATCVYLYRSGWYDRMAQRVAWALNSHLVRARKLRRPQYIIMVRHGQSEGNVDQGMFARKPDSAMKLTKKGRKQVLAHTLQPGFIDIIFADTICLLSPDTSSSSCVCPGCSSWAEASKVPWSSATAYESDCVAVREDKRDV